MQKTTDHSEANADAPNSLNGGGKKKNDSLIPSPTSTGSVPYMSGKLILYPLLGNIQEFNSFFFVSRFYNSAKWILTEKTKRRSAAETDYLRHDSKKQNKTTKYC